MFTRWDDYAIPAVCAVDRETARSVKAASGRRSFLAVGWNTRMNAKDHYATLGVSRDADQDAIKTAYRKLAMRHHPDRNPGDKQAEARFKDVSEAYDILKDEQKRAAYNRLTEPPRTAAGTSGQNGHPEWPGFADFWDAGDGGSWPGFADKGRRQRGSGTGRQQETKPKRKRRPDDPVFRISLETAWKGGIVNAQMDADAACVCSGCHGTGSKHACVACGGTGRVAMASFWSRGLMTNCFHCGGSGRPGKSAGKQCPDCQGTGIIARTVHGTVAVPPGAADGDPGKFTDDRGTAHRVTFAVRRDRRFERNGDNLVLKRSVSATRAARGTTMTIACIDGRKRRVRVPQGTADGTVLRLGGLGMPSRRGGFGDLLIRLSVTSAKRK